MFNNGGFRHSQIFNRTHTREFLLLFLFCSFLFLVHRLYKPHTCFLPSLTHHQVAVFTGWTLATGTALAIIYGPFAPISEPRFLEVGVATFYNGASRPLWGACIAWVIVACTCGYGGELVVLAWSQQGAGGGGYPIDTRSKCHSCPTLQSYLA